MRYMTPGINFYREPPGLTHDTKDSRADFGILQRLRVELQDLGDIIHSVEKGQTDLDACRPYIQKTMDDIHLIIDVITEREAQYSGYADTIRRILNIWEQIAVNPILSCESGTGIDSQERTILTAQQQIHALGMFHEQMKQIIFEIGFLTIPGRLTGWLKTMTPGRSIPFHDIFENEMPDYGDRVKLLNLIAWSPKTLMLEGGIVEPDTGLVYCYENNSKKRRVGYVILICLVLLLTAGIAGLAYVPLDGWPLVGSNVSSLLFGWAAVIGGVLVHLGLSFARQQKASRSPGFAFSDIPLMISAKFGQITLKMLLCFIGFAGLVFAAGIENAKPLNAFFVGYSLDSFIGVLTSSLEQKGSAQLATLKQQLGITGKS